jgi:phospholipase A1
MSRKIKIMGVVFLTLFVCSALHAQREIEEMWQNQLDTGRMNYNKPWYLQIGEEDILKLLDNQPSFGMYKDNYIITGVPTNGAINKYTADCKFQISVSQRLTKTVLPFTTSMMLTYTQKSFWEIYRKSAPFGDSNYNPGLAFVKPVIRNNQLKGVAVLALEHESNGKDSLESRSWNYLTLSGVYFFNACFSVQAKVWAGILEQPDEDYGSVGNPDLYKYRGYGLIALNYRSLNDKLWVSAVLNPRSKFGRFNTQVELNIKLNVKSNQYFFVQWYNGYGESLLDYNKYTSMLRMGICIKPPMRNFY